MTVAHYTTRVLDRLETSITWTLGLLALDVALLARVLYLLGGV
jgi:hypothetical protein